MSPYDGVPPAPADGASPSTFKEVLAHLASGVAIISCWDGPTPRGLLVSSITGLSVEPPRFLFCVRKAAGSHDALVASSECGVALLGLSDQDEALRFASSSRAAERFAPDRWRLTAPTPPAYRGGLASIRCDVERVTDAGGHSIIIVSATDSLLTPGLPLVAWNRGFLHVALARHSAHDLRHF